MTTKAKIPTIPITELEQSAFCQTDKKLTSKTLEEEFGSGVRWQKIPIKYLKMKPDELDTRIKDSKSVLGSRLVILGHHYQRDEVIKYADYRGDSFKLSQFAASQSDSEFIVFCGVHFMAETADILSSNHQKVILPNLTAGCSMADMAHVDDVLDCWDDLLELGLSSNGVVPITYMNSTAGIKALCGRNNGIVCTSTNAAGTFEWALNRSDKILFLPDQHLGRNTGLKLGIDVNDMIVWDPFKPLGGHSKETIRNSKIILWKGHCSVHTRFTVDQIEQARIKYPDVHVVVHPECTKEVVESADSNGSTEYIKRVVEESEPGTTWAIGTEINLVNRLAAENKDKTVFCLDNVVCPCATMYRIHPAYLAWILESLEKGEVVNQIKVDGCTANEAKIALDRMLSIT